MDIYCTADSDAYSGETIRTWHLVQVLSVSGLKTLTQRFVAASRFSSIIEAKRPTAANSCPPHSSYGYRRLAGKRVNATGGFNQVRRSMACSDTLRAGIAANRNKDIKNDA